MWAEKKRHSTLHVCLTYAGLPTHIWYMSVCMLYFDSSSVVSLSLSGPLNTWGAQLWISLTHGLCFIEATSDNPLSQTSLASLLFSLSTHARAQTHCCHHLSSVFFTLVQTETVASTLGLTICCRVVWCDFRPIAPELMVSPPHGTMGLL